MNIDDVLKNAKNMTSYEIRQKLERLVRVNYRYQNLDKNNRKIVMELIRKYIDKTKRGHTINSYDVRDEMHKLRKDMIKKKLTEEDLKDIRELLDKFKT